MDPTMQTTSINILPNAVLQRICLHPDVGSDVVQVLDPNTFARVVMNVSKRWRALALSTPQLWSTICVNLEGDPDAWYSDIEMEEPNFDEDYVEKDPVKDMVGPFVEKCISLSQELPLNIKLVGVCSSEFLGESCVRALVESAHRWQHAFVDNTGGLLHDITSKISLPILETLHICNISAPVSFSATPRLVHLGVDDVHRSGRISFQTLPSLRSLKLIRIDRHLSAFEDMPWSQITSLLLRRDCDTSELHQMLNSVSNLKYLGLLGGVLDISQPLTMPSLEMLEMNSRTGIDVLDFLSSPSLTSLRLDKFDFVPVVDFIKRSKCTLKRLDLEQMPLEGWNSIDEVKQLKHLTLRHPRTVQYIITVSDFQLLLKDKYGQCLFPELESLEVYVDESNAQAEDMLFRMLESRLPTKAEVARENWLEDCEKPCYLKSVYVRFNQGISVHGEEVMRAFLKSDVVRGSGARVEVWDYGSHCRMESSCFIGYTTTLTQLLHCIAFELTYDEVLAATVT